MRRWIGSALAALLIPFSIPATTNAQTEHCFTETGICISGRIKEFWEQNGGLSVFGLPIAPQQSETIEGKTFDVQWFERNRLELHPENKAPYDVLIGRVGADRLAQQGREAFPPSQQQEGCHFFAETQQNVCGPMWTAWQANGLETDGRKGHSAAESLALFGLPLSGQVTEKIGDKEYTVQYFERARFELHPEVAADTVLFGLLGAELHAAATAPAATPEPTPTPEGNVPQLPAPSYNACKDDATAASAPNYPVQLHSVDKKGEIVTLQNVTDQPVDITGWHVCSVRGSQEFLGITGVLAPYEAKEFPNVNGENIWSNENQDDGILYNANGQAVSYWHDANQP